MVSIPRNSKRVREARQQLIRECEAREEGAKIGILLWIGFIALCVVVACVVAFIQPRVEICHTPSSCLNGIK